MCALYEDSNITPPCTHHTKQSISKNWRDTDEVRKNIKQRILNQIQDQLI